MTYTGTDMADMATYLLGIEQREPQQFLEFISRLSGRTGVPPQVCWMYVRLYAMEVCR